MTPQKKSHEDLTSKIEMGGTIRNKFEVFQKKTPLNKKAQLKQKSEMEKAF